MYKVELIGNNLFDKVVDLFEHLWFNGYHTQFSGNILFVPEDEFFEVRTILEDRNLDFEVVSYLVKEEA